MFLRAEITELYSLVQNKTKPHAKQLRRFIELVGQMGVNSSLDSEGNTAYILASKYGHVEYLRALYQEFNDTLNLDLQNHEGLYPLTCAVMNNHLEAATVLIEEQQARVSVFNTPPLKAVPLSQAKTAVHFALENKNLDMAMLFDKHGAFLNAKNRKSYQALVESENEKQRLAEYDRISASIKILCSTTSGIMSILKKECKESKASPVPASTPRAVKFSPKNVDVLPENNAKAVRALMNSIYGFRPIAPSSSEMLEETRVPTQRAILAS